MSKNLITVDGNEAAASVAFRVSEVTAIFPITPSSPMAELCDEWANRGKTNLWGIAPEIEEMRGNMSFQKIPNPAVYEREIFRRMFSVDVQAGSGEEVRTWHK